MSTGKLLHYKDICLIPNYSNLNSRSKADTSVVFGGRKFKVPVIPSNMKCVIDLKLAKWLSDNDYFYSMHRFDVSNIDILKHMTINRWKFKSISVGVGDNLEKDIHDMKKENLYPDYLLIDIAHGDSSLMEKALYRVKEQLPSSVFVIAGNVATIDGYLNLVEWGADAIKVGIGSGKICSTKNKTGFTYPMYSCIGDIVYNLECKYRSSLNKELKVPIIADGGIREHGDIVKAIHAGATMVMVGGLFSKLMDSPAEVLDGHKIYFGSASQYNKGEYKHVEGIKKVIEIEAMTYEQKMIEIQQDIQSAISYSGGDKLLDIRNVDCGIVSSWEV